MYFTRRMENRSLKTVLLIVHVWLSSIDLSTASSLTCSPSQSSGVAFLIRSHRNRTGHWHTQVDFEHDDGRGSALDPKNTGRFTVAVQHTRTSASCDGATTMVIRTTVTVPPVPPGSDYELFPHVGYYKLHTGAVTWSRARDVCAQEGTHLAIINSQQEADIMVQLLARYPKFENATSSEYAYIGFHDQDNEGQFVTVFGDPLTKVGYLRWHGEEPNLSETNNEDCGLVHRDGKLADVVCYWIQPFVCEQELY